MVLGLLLTILLGVRTQHEVDKAAVRQFAYASDQITIKVRERLEDQQRLLYGGAAFMTASELVTREDWRRYWEASKTQELLPGLQGFGFAQLIRPDQLQEHIQSVRNEGFSDYSVRPAGPREIYTSIVYLEPFADRNLRAFGYDMFSEPVRRLAMERARSTGLATLSGPVELVQEDGHNPQVGVLMYVPAYRKAATLMTPSQREAALLGWVYSPYRMNDLMAGMLGDWQGRLGTEIALSVYDGDLASEANLLYRTGRINASLGNEQFAQQRLIDFNGRKWLLTFDVMSAQAQLDYVPLIWMLSGGSAVTWLLFWLIRNLQSRNQLARQMAEKLTADIRHQEQRLKEDEFRWNFALDGSGIGVWDRNFETGKVFYSLRCAHLLGYVDEKIGNGVEAWQERIDPKDQPAVMRQLQAYIDGQAPEFDATYRLKLKDGTHRWVRDRGTIVLRGDSGQPLRMIGTLSDVSDRMLSTMRIQQLARLNAVMSECNAAIIRCTTKDQLFERITQLVVESGEVKMCWIGLLDPETGMITPVHAFGKGTDYLQGIQISVKSDDPRGQGATGTAIRENQPVWIEDFRTDPRTAPWRDRAAEYGWRSSAALPIAHAGQVIGALTFYDDKTGWYDGEVRSLLEGLAAQIGFAVDKYDVQAEVQAHQKRVLEASAHLQQVLEAMPVPIQIFSLTQQRFRFINRANRHWLGYELEEVENWQQWFNVMYPADIGAERMRLWENAIKVMQPGQPLEMPETTVLSKDGTTQVGRVRATLVGDEIVLAWIDLTEIRRQGAELRESERRFRSMIEKAVTGMYVRRDRKLIYVNESFCQMLGRSADELLGHELTDFADISPQEWDKVMKAWDHVEAGRRNVPIEVTLRHKTGANLEVGIQLSSIEWEDGQTAVIGLADDITARKRAAVQLDNYVKRLEASLQATLGAVATMVELRDPYTAGHERRVGLLGAAIGQEMGWPAEQCKTLEMVGLVHDIGKIAVPAEILAKPTRLTPIEMQLVREHAQAGYDILKDVPFDAPVAETIRQHHERMDGSGYPRGLKGDEILPEARVLAVADVLESMAAHRPYRPALGIDVAVKELEQGRGRLYDSEVVDAVLRLIREKGYVLPQ